MKQRGKAVPKLKFNPQTPLYTSDAKPWRLEQFPEVWQLLQGAGRPVVIFVHGRGKEPGKSLLGATFTQGLAVHKIERGYDVRVLMFNWDSAFHGFSFLDREVPLSHTAAGAIALGKMLSLLESVQAANAQHAKPALLIHSMGSIVVQRAIQDGHWPQAKGLFSSVLFSQPDADDVGHSLWLESLAQREKTFVTLNRDDHVLARSTDARPAGAHALGLGTSQPLAPKAVYVDISRMGPTGEKDEDHEVFGKGAMNDQLHICEFFNKALRGQTPTLDPNINVESIEREVVYRLRDHRVPGALCLKVPELPKFHPAQENFDA